MARPIVGICMVRDAADVIGTVVRHHLAELDAVIVADNLSTDGTSGILLELCREFSRLVVVDDPDPAYRQGHKMTHLARVASTTFGARWIVPFDADEVWYSPFGLIRDVLDELPSHIAIAEATLYDHVVTGADDELELDPIRRISWRRTAPGALPKVACRFAEDLRIELGNHGAHYGDDRTYAPAAAVAGRLVVRHFPYRSAEQMWRKAHDGAEALRAAPELDDTVGKHWRDYAALGPDALREVFGDYFHVPNPNPKAGVVHDPAPLR